MVLHSDVQLDKSLYDLQAVLSPLATSLSEGPVPVNTKLTVKSVLTLESPNMHHVYMTGFARAELLGKH